jgi:hypothetical protein
MDGSSAQSLYREEKARALQERRLSHAQLMSEAKEAFAKMLADAQLARKGGRPRTNPQGPIKPITPRPMSPIGPPPEEKTVAVKPVSTGAKAGAKVGKTAKPKKVAAAKQAKGGAKKAKSASTSAKASPKRFVGKGSAAKRPAKAAGRSVSAKAKSAAKPARAGAKKSGGKKR